MNNIAQTPTSGVIFATAYDPNTMQWLNKSKPSGFSSLQQVIDMVGPHYMWCNNHRVVYEYDGYRLMFSIAPHC